MTGLVNCKLFSGRHQEKGRKGEWKREKGEGNAGIVENWNNELYIDHLYSTFHYSIWNLGFGCYDFLRYPDTPLLRYTILNNNFSKLLFRIGL